MIPEDRVNNKISYLCLDYGIDVCGVKGASVHLRSICQALAAEGPKVQVHCSRFTGQLSEFKLEGVEVIVHALPRDFLKLRKSLREAYHPKLVIPPEVRQCAINRDALTYLEDAWREAPPCLVLERLSLMGWPVCARRRSGNSGNTAQRL